MKIDANQLVEGETEVFAQTLEPGCMDLEVSGSKLSAAISISAKVTKVQDTLDVNVSLASNALIQCSRCLCELSIPIKKNFRLDYSLADGMIVDIAEDIRQEIILGYPLKPLCNPSCKGLCLACGKNLNESSCGCGKQSIRRHGGSGIKGL